MRKRKEKTNTARQMGLPLPPEEIARLEQELVQVVLDAKKVKAEFKEVATEYRGRHQALQNRSEAIAQELQEQERIREDRQTVEIITEHGPLQDSVPALSPPTPTPEAPGEMPIEAQD